MSVEVETQVDMFCDICGTYVHEGVETVICPECANRNNINHGQICRPFAESKVKYYCDNAHDYFFDVNKTYKFCPCCGKKVHYV